MVSSTGIVADATRIAEETLFPAALATDRSELVGATEGPSLGIEELPAARARASRLATRAASTLVVSGGGRSILADNHAQRLAREAMFLLVFGQTAAIRRAQMELEELALPSGSRRE